MLKKLYAMFMEIFPKFYEIEESLKLESEGFMDLNLDVLDVKKERILVALSHYYKHECGDMIADPDMEIAIYPEKKELEALSFQNSLVYQTVYDDINDPTTVDSKARAGQNEFLQLWLTNLKDQGFSQ